jgi:hypothetical protein
MQSISFEVFVAFQWWPALVKTCKGFILLLKSLLHPIEFNSNFTYMLQSAVVEDNIY